MVKEKIINRRFVRNSLFGLHSLSKKFENGNDTLIITEGVTDAISVIQSGYPCLSPVTIQFKEKDYKPLTKYCKRFSDKIVIINDNEVPKEGDKYCLGLLGSIRTATYLYKNGISNVNIGQLPRNSSEDKVDIDSFLAKFSITNQYNELKKIVDSSVPIINWLTNELKKDFEKIVKKEKDEDVILSHEKNELIERGLREIIECVPKENTVVIEQLKSDVKKYLKLSPASFNKLSKDVKKVKKEKKQKEHKEQTQEFLYHDNWRIMEKETGLYVAKEGEDNDGNLFITEEQSLLLKKLELLSKTKDKNLEGESRYNFIYDKEYHHTKTIREMINLFGINLHKGGFGRDVFSTFMVEKSKLLPFRRPEYVLGFRNGWKLPCLEDELGISLICQTDLMRKTYENARDMIIEYTDDEKIEIKDIMKKLLDKTSVDKLKLAITIGWCIAAPFRLEFIKMLQLFPLLLLTGPLNAGKTYIEELFIIEFYKIWKTHFSSTQLHYLAQMEDILASTTFPTNFQEVHALDRKMIALAKDHANINSPYFRKKNATQFDIYKDKIAALSLDANYVPEGLDSPALNTKMIHLQFQETIQSQEGWVQLYLKLIKYNLFSLVYEKTRDWNSKKIKTYIDGIKKKYDEGKFDSYARLSKIFTIVQFGLLLFKKVFEYDFGFTSSQIFEELAHERRSSQKSFHDLFFEFCREAINYDPGIDLQLENGGTRHVRGDNKPYITTLLKKNKAGFYIFTNLNKKDFDTFSGQKRSMPRIANLVRESLEEKSLVKCARHSLSGKTLQGIKIDPKFFEDEKRGIGE